MTRRPRPYACLLLAGLLFVSGRATAFDAAEHLQPRQDRYDVEWTGIGLGEGTIALRPQGDGCYQYTSTTDPIALVRWLYGAPREESRFCVRDGAVVPQRFEYINDKRESDSFRLEFDWRGGQIKTLKAGVMTVRDLPEQAYDRFSIREAVRLWVLRHVAGEAPAEAEFVMVDDDRFKPYRFRIAGVEAVQTPAGRFEALRVDYVHKKREQHYWLAPDRDYVPVRIEQLKDGKVELRMTLVR